MTTRYATALSHIVLAGTGIYCYLNASEDYFFPQCSFSTIVVNCLIGIWRWGNPIYGYDSIRLYKFTTLLQDLLALPCIVSTVWLQYGYAKEIAYLYSLISILPLINYILDKAKVNGELLDLLIGANCLTLGTLCFIYQNYFGVAACLSYAFSHFVIKNDNETYFNVTSQDLYNYAMCFFALFSLRAIWD